MTPPHADLQVVLVVLSIMACCLSVHVVHSLAPCNHPHINIERVKTKERCLDVEVFRRLSIRSERDKNEIDDDESAATLAATILRQEFQSKEHLMMKDYETYGGGIVQFAATLPPGAKELIVGSTEAEFLGSVKARTFELPNRIHIKNLRVHKHHRRKGIATALLSTVMQYTFEEIPTATAVSLKVEQMINPGSAMLYEKEGFVFNERVYPGFMIKTL
mmetsp:Transcript_792/g.1681  ORF Transcript_792/g.1681 Transcript_792/m.1681 type:complete len:218 (+) Transcript_792:143-796(+)